MSQTDHSSTDYNKVSVSGPVIVISHLIVISQKMAGTSDRTRSDVPFWQILILGDRVATGFQKEDTKITEMC